MIALLLLRLPQSRLLNTLMRALQSLFLVLTCFIASTAAAIHPDGRPIAIQRIVGDDNLPLRDWACVGPIALSPDTDEAGVGSDLLRAFDRKESDPFLFSDYDDPPTVVESDTPPGYRCLPMVEGVNFFNLYQLDKSKDAPHHAYYLSTIIESKDAVNASLLLASDGLVVAWWNQEPVGSSTTRRVTETYNTRLPITIKRGRNVLTVKVVRPLLSGGLQAMICINPAKQLNTLLFKDGYFINSLFIDSGNQPLVKVLCAPEDERIHLRITGMAERPIYEADIGELSGGFKIPSVFIDGLYRARASQQSKQYDEWFYVGDVDTACKIALEKAKEKARDDNNWITLKGLIRRMEILYLPENIKRTDREWQAKVLFTLRQIYAHDAEVMPLSNKNGYAITSGIHILGFQSAIDGGDRFYRLYLPPHNALTPEKLPLMVVVPTSTSAYKPFIESAFVSKHLEAAKWGRIADDLGVGILWCGYPCEPYGHEIEFTHLEEVLTDVAKLCNIDYNRLYLLGTCRSGMTAAMTARCWPQRFAAIGLLDPIFSRHRNYPQDDDRFFRFSAYRDWLFDCAPLEHLAELVGNSFVIVYDGAEPGHGTLEDANEFIRMGAGKGVNTELTVAPPSLDHMTGWEEVMRRLVAYKRIAPSSQTAAVPGRDNRHGPVSRVVAEPFVVIIGTKGSVDEQKASKRIAQQFSEAWNKVNYSGCKVINDDEVTEHTLSSSNLVLCGGFESNLIWNRLTSEPIVRYSKASVRIADAEFKGDDIAFIATVNGSANGWRRILLIHATNESAVALKTLNCTLDGWFDFAVWITDPDTKLPKLVAAKRYEHGW